MTSPAFATFLTDVFQHLAANSTPDKVCDRDTEKLAELFAESATEEHALRPVRRRRLDS
jgi:hypothetical protein